MAEVRMLCFNEWESAQWLFDEYHQGYTSYLQVLDLGGEAYFIYCSDKCGLYQWSLHDVPRTTDLDSDILCFLQSTTAKIEGFCSPSMRSSLFMMQRFPKIILLKYNRKTAKKTGESYVCGIRPKCGLVVFKMCTTEHVQPLDAYVC